MRRVDFYRACSPIALYIVLVRVYSYLVIPQKLIVSRGGHDKSNEIIMSRFTTYSINCKTVVAS